MSDFASCLTRTVARQYDLFQTSLESLQKDRKFLNYGYTVSGKETYEERQQRLCLEVFQAAEIRKRDVIVDVGFGSGEQDFLLSNGYEFARLIGFNISERQVRYAQERAIREHLAHKLSFHLGEAERVGGEFPNCSANTPERTRLAVTPPESDVASAFTQDAARGGISSGQHDARFGGARVTPPSASDTARDSVAAIDTN
jgi:SAM-dependent methyltransferase